LTQHLDYLRAAFLAARKHRPFTVDAIVIFARSPALRLDVASRGRGFLHPLA
jgi:hypothetical protein